MTSVLVTKMSTVRILLSLVVNFNWQLEYFDVKNIFLYGELVEEIYMDIYCGFAKGGEENKVCKRHFMDLNNLSEHELRDLLE